MKENRLVVERQQRDFNQVLHYYCCYYFVGGADDQTESLTQTGINPQLSIPHLLGLGDVNSMADTGGQCSAKDLRPSA